MKRTMKLLALVFAVLFIVTALPTAAFAAKVSSYNCQYSKSKYGGGSKYFYIKAEGKTCKLTFSCGKGELNWAGDDIMESQNAKVYGAYEVKIYKWDKANNRTTGKAILPANTDVWNTKSKTITFTAEKGCYYRVQVYFWASKTTSDSYWRNGVIRSPLAGADSGCLGTPYWESLPTIKAQNKSNCTLYNSKP